MNESNRNTRTLIVSFVVAIMALIPLRFVEVGQLMGDAQVLGATTSSVVVMPVETVKPANVLEAPYNEIETATPTVKCLTVKEANKLATAVKKDIVSRKMPASEVQGLLTQLDAIEANTCK